MAEPGPTWPARQAHHKESWSARLESTWRVHVEPKWGRRRIADIRRTEVQTWVAQLKLSASSVAHAHTVLADILDNAVADRRLATNTHFRQQFHRWVQAQLEAGPLSGPRCCLEHAIDVQWERKDRAPKGAQVFNRLGQLRCTGLIRVVAMLPMGF